MKDSVQKYFQAWLNADIEPLKTIFAGEIVYSECYGPEYRGISQILQWFDDWNKKGKVLRWDINRVIEADRTAIAEWYFECIYDGKTEGFNGVTVADFNDRGKIVRLSEYQSKAEHCFPYGE